MIDSQQKSLKMMLFEPNFTLNQLIQMNLLIFKEEIVEISQKAQQENILEKILIDLERNFDEKSFKLKPLDPLSDILVLIETEDLFQSLDEIISSINVLLSSKYSISLKKRAENLQKNVMILEDLLEKWVECQEKWRYFSRIFSMNEVKRDLISQASSFQNSDKILKNLMKRILLNTSLAKLLKNSGLSEQFMKFIDGFAKLERELEAYLDTKRGFFARLCFLSNEELLDLLSKTQDIPEIQPFLLKIYDNVHHFTILPDLSINSVISQENETLELKKLVFFKGSLETWLENLLTSIQDTLKKLVRKGLYDILTPGQSKIEFIEGQIGQIAALVLMINWTMAIEVVFCDKNQKGFEEIYDISLLDLEKLIKKLQFSEEILGLKLKNQLMFDLFSRDLLQKLIIEGVSEKNDYIWQQTLRLYNDIDSNEIILCQLSLNFPYSFEYQGLKPRLVITPLTSRCFLTISTAFSQGLGVSLCGPAGTGKTETVKELSKFCGIFCIVFNCSEQISHKTLNQMLMGLVLQGVWGCLDEFNRLNIEVLSIISQQLLVIRMAFIAKLGEIDFEGKIVGFRRKTWGFCITMNPGYKGRREIPENLKALLRPIYMILPNFVIIAEVLLNIQGFFKGKELANKLFRLYQLCESQLSQQNHYDFGLRALKSLLSGIKTRKNNDLIEEEAVIIHALERDIIGKLLPFDVVLFKELISDVFPDRKQAISSENSPELHKKILNSCEELGIQPNSDLFLSQILFLYESTILRYGLILLGSSQTGKSTVFSILSHFLQITPIIINPKSLSIGDLFGFITKSGEWKEGLATFLIKEANSTQKPSYILFDGPIDSFWIENLNSVLDDNRTLCLANSERIPLKKNMRFFFETDQLKNASPATISRCGVVFFAESPEIWLKIFESWIERLQGFKSEESFEKSINSEMAIIIKELGIKVLKEGFDRLKALGEENVEIQCVKGVCNVFEVILNRKEVSLEGNKEEIKRKFNYIWAFAFLWGACAVFDIPNNKVF